MDIDEIIRLVADYTREMGPNHWQKAAIRDSIFMSEIDRLSPLDPTHRLPERVMAVIETPICPLGNRKKFKSINRGWAFCQNKCLCAKEHAAAKIKNTLIDRYGVNHQSQIDGVQDRIRQTNANKSRQDQIKIIEKRKQTSMDRFGVEFNSQTEQAKSKLKSTNIIRYGVEYPLQNELIKKSIDQEDLKRKRKISSIAKYGVPYPTQRHIDPMYLDILMDKSLLEKYCDGKSFESVADDMGVDSSTVLSYWNDHGLRVAKSSYEKEISTWLDQLSVKFISNSRKIITGYELDFYLPDHNLAIEFNGLYWHSSFRKENNYHRMKYEACRDAGIRLLMINEDEWGDPVRRKIANIVKKSVKGMGARHLTIDRISKTQANDFCDDFHIQGKTGLITHAMGAFTEGILVGVMVFNKQRGTHAIELIRFCSDGKSYAGMFSKLFKHSVEEFLFNKVISFADLRYSNGDVYHKNGFELVDEISHDYRYVYRKKTHHKSSFTKKKIAKRFGLDMSTMTEKEAMDSLNIPRIYDCGKLKFEWRRP